MAARAEIAQRTGKKGDTERRTDLTGYLFVLPFLIAYGLFLVWPVILGLRMSFFDWSLVGTGTRDFLGLANYRELFGDPNFWASLWHTILFTLLSTPPLVLLAFGLALLANRAVPARWFFRLAFFAPYVLPVSTVALIWVWLYQPGFGLINSYLVSLGLPEVDWLAGENVAMISVVIATVWWTIGFNFVLYLAGLQEIPEELYEAGALDGAGSYQQTRYITIPLLSRTTFLVFDQIYVMNTSGGLNYTVTRPAIQYIYEQGFTQYRIGFAAAMSYVFFVMILVFTIMQFVLSRRRRREA